jgi:histidine triad (HIT) family protein
MSSVFSKIMAGEIPSYEVVSNRDFVAFLDINPVTKGHTLVVPRREVDYIFDIQDKQLSELMLFAKSVAKAMKKVIDCKRIGIAVIGLEVPHAHIHLIPINDESDLDFHKTRKEFTPQEFEAIAAAIADAY